ncbi:hypothetical protein KC352_g22747 [Hortaea werneckii]|nr:hypothetical protein KC352_g22747 [Hortaea werneckii]
MDGDEEAYFDDIEEDEAGTGLPSMEDAAAKPDGVVSSHGGAASPMKPLVNYPEDEEEDAMDILASSPDREPGGSKKVSSIGEAGGRAGVTDADAPCEDAMDLVNDDSFEPSQTTEHERERGRDRQPVPLESSPGTLSASASPPGPPTPAKRRREDDEDDEMSMLMGSGRASSSNKRRSSAASITSGTHHVQLDGSTSPGAIQNSELPSKAAETQQGGDLSVRSPPKDLQGLEQPVEDAQVGQPAPSQDGSRPSLRRKGSLKTRNMGSENKFVVKPIQLASNAGEKKEEQGK